MGASTSRGQVEDVGRALAVDPIASILQRYSDALIPEARCRAARLCLEGSKSRNRLSEVPAWPVLFFPRVMGWNSSRWTPKRSPESILFSESAMRALSLRVCALQVALGASLSALLHAQTATVDTAIEILCRHG